MRWFFSIACLCFIIQIGYCQCEDKCYGLKKFQSTVGKIDLEKLIQSEFAVSDVHTPLSYDMDGDGINELMVMPQTVLEEPFYGSDTLYIVDGKTLEIKWKIKVPFYNNANPQPIAIVDVDKDCVPEIFLAALNHEKNPESTRGKLICFDILGNIKWISNKDYGVNFNFVTYGGMVGIADFNRDGIPEVYIHNEIYNSITGVKLCDGKDFGMGIGDNYAARRFKMRSMTIAEDVDNEDGNLELIAGYTVYKVNITNSNGEAGNTMMPINFALNGKNVDGFVAISDIDNDGKLDVVYSAMYPSISSNLYVYTVDSQQIKLLNSSKFNSNYGYWLPSYLTVGQLNDTTNVAICSFNSSVYLIKISKDTIFSLSEIIITDSSGKIGVTTFDLNHDGFNEIIVRDDNDLHLITLDENGNLKASIRKTCVSPTLSEMPIVTALEKNGEARICVTCMDQNGDGKLTIFGPPPGQHWAPARNIWHQYAYNPLFINDDGTVPQYMQNPATYKNGKYNNFMVQESLIDEDGNYPVAAASLLGDITCINSDPVMKEYIVTFGVENRSDASKTAGSNLPISFYSGDPQAGGTLLTTYHTDVDVQAGERIVRTVTIPETSMTSIWMIVNTDKYPIVVSNTSHYDIDECDYTDNVFQTLMPYKLLKTEEICQGDTYDFYGDLLTTSGAYSHQIMNVSGCDSLITILNLQVIDRKTAQETVATCENLNWNGSTYTQSGKYTYQTQSTNGCDSIVTLNLTIHPMESLTITQSACDSYSWNGNIYDTSGKYPFQSQTIFGCDSIIILDLTIHPSYDIMETKAACDSITWQGTTYKQSGIYTITNKTIAGCDSIRTLDLTISSVLNTSESQSACTSYDWNGNTYTQSGQYTYQTMSSSGCDSLVTLDLIIHPMESLTIIQSACDGYTWHGMTYDTSGQYTYLSHTIFGCDSITTLDLTIHPSYDIKEKMAACDSITWQGTTYKQSGVYSVATKTIAGCDSIRTLDLTVNYRSSSDDSQEACTIYLWNGTEYTSSGTYTYITKNQAGCDSLATLTLDIYPEFHQGDTIETDKDYLWPIDGRTYTESGQYVAVYASQEGCDSIYTLVLRINREISIVFPTIFNPSGTANPIFFGSSNRSDITLPNLSIYDRWGNIVFTKKNAQLNNPSDGWDGRYRGQSCAQGVYVWVAEVTYDDGHTEMLHGDVTVVR
ncbi:MAG: gliding motility-associated C-terminal domain-containing protein [Lewinellaceae bacterium]|nr:gliding motility-associated C-terminal domain-containing protein [Lewinellaceae bacterium]